MKLQIEINIIFITKIKNIHSLHSADYIRFIFYLSIAH